MSEKEKIDDGGPAFPVVGMGERAGQPFTQIFNGGMSLRQYYAGMALQGILGVMAQAKNEYISRQCFDLADAMILKSKEG